MRRRLSLLFPLVGCLFLGGVSQVQAADEVLKLVPDSALGFVLVNRPPAADAKLQQLERQLGLPATGLLGKFKEATGIHEGVDEKGAACILALPPEGEKAGPRVVVLIPVTDYEKFLQPLKPEDAGGAISKVTIHGKEVVIRKIDGYAAMTDPEHREAIEKGLKVAAEVPAGLAPWQKWLAGNDVAWVVLQPGIKLGTGKARSAIAAMKPMLEAAGEQGKSAAAGLDLYIRFFGFAEKEVAAFGLGVRLDKQGVLRVSSRTRVVPGGECAKLLAQAKPAKEDLLAGMPDEPFVIAGGMAASEAGWEGLMRFSFDMLSSMRSIYGLSEEQIQKVRSLPMDWIKQVHGFSLVLGVGRSGEPLYSNLLVTMRADNAKKFLADYEKYLKQYGEVTKGSQSLALPPMETEKTKVGGVDALQISMQMKAPAGMPNAGQVDRMMESMFGHGGRMVAWMVPADEHTVVAGYVDKARLEQAIQAIKQGKPGLSADAEVAKTAALLPKGPAAVVYWSPRGTLEFVQQLVATFVPPEAASKIKIPEFPKTPPIGIAAWIAPNEFRTEMAVPPDVLKGIGEVVRKAKGQPAP